jgi:hypothetical protein
MKSLSPIYYGSDYSDDEGNDVLTAEFCSDLGPFAPLVRVCFSDK